MATIFGKLIETYGPIDTIVFDIQNVADYYWRSEKVDWNIVNGDFPNLAPPYPDFFMQYAIKPGKIVAEEGEVAVEKEELFGFHFKAKEVDVGEVVVIGGHKVIPEVKWLLSFTLAAFIGDFEQPIIDDTHFTIGVDDSGGYVPVWGNTDQPMLIDSTPDNPLMHDAALRSTYVKQIFSLVHPCFLAITFLHTKNTVVVEGSKRPKSISKSAKRRLGKKREGEPFYTFHTLDIRPLREVLRKGGAENQQSGRLGKVGLHLVRGHFADYTERGLFGKDSLKGVYWIEPHIRGSMGKGVVDKSYRVHVPKGEEDNG